MQFYIIGDVYITYFANSEKGIFKTQLPKSYNFEQDSWKAAPSSTMET